MGILIPLFIVIICCIVIWRASDGFTVASEYIGRNLSEGVRGATINAIGSSLPEVFTTFFFLFYLRDVDGFSGGIGTTAGSAIFNGMIIPAFVILVVILTGLANKITVSQKVFFRDGFSLIMAELLFIIIISGDSLNWWHGVLLMVIYFVYLFYMLKSMKSPDEDSQTPGVPELKIHEPSKGLWYHLLTFDLEPLFIGNNKITNIRAWALLIFSTFSIAFTCLILVQACEWIGSAEYTIPYIGTFEGLNIPIMFVAIILASAASSVPDTIISMNDARKGNYDDAISNALGSNIFDICFALGFPLFLYTIINGPIVMQQETIDQSAELRMLLLLLTIIAFGVYTFRKTINSLQAYMLLGIYGIFTLYVIGRGANHPVANATAEFLRNVVSFLDFF